MYNEIKFLFNIDNTKMNNKKNIGGDTVNVDLFPDYDAKNRKSNEINIPVTYKGDDNKNDNKIKEFLDNSSYYNDDDQNSYISLIEKLNEDNANESLKFGYKELAYLTDLGVYPVNRMIILRRFSEGIEVPHNLNKSTMKGIRPISTIIGWINPENENILGFGFNEEWITNTDLFWDKISEILEKETGTKANMTLPAPGWAQGFVFNFLREMGYVDEESFDKSEIPAGDPDVLHESSQRKIDGQGITSSFKIDLKTSYEQKYINNIDPGSAFLDIINNSLRMGTSDMKFFLGNKANTIMDSLNSDSDSFIQSMFETLKNMAGDFINTINNLLGEIGNDIKSGDFTENMYNTILDGLNAALYRFRWPLRSSLALTTGQNTTPWHVTIGNPLNPILSMANVVVDNGNVDLNNELGFNDIPTKINLSFNISQGRSLGKQEIMEVLNNSYVRDYSKQNI